MTTSPRTASHGPLTRHERLLVVAASAAPIVLAMVVLSPFVLLGDASGAELLGAGFVYGGLVALAAGFVTYDRLQARQCPRCTTRNPRAAATCDDCGYDLVERPRWRCSEGHPVRLDPGLCDCGRRLERADAPRGIGREVRGMVVVGAWMLGFLLVIGLVLNWISG